MTGALEVVIGVIWVASGAVVVAMMTIGAEVLEEVYSVVA